MVWNWITQLDKGTCILVPNRSLQAELAAKIAQLQVQAGHSVWKSARIFTWSDLLAHLWQENRHQLSTAYTLLETHQSQLIWERVVRESQTRDQELALLNIQQTAKAAANSWKMAHEWQLDTQSFALSEISDTRQFGVWCRRYQEILVNARFLDQVGVYEKLLELAETKSLRSRYSSLIWFGFDLETAAQSKFQSITLEADFQHQKKSADLKGGAMSYVEYPSIAQELQDVFQQCRAELEKDSSRRINIVIPNLHLIQDQVHALAAEVFYPNKRACELRTQNLVYRFSLGKPMFEWPAITAAIKCIHLLKGRVSTEEFLWILRNQYFSNSQKLRAETRVLGDGLRNSRIRELKIDDLILTLSSLEFEQGSPLLQFITSLVDYYSKLQSELDEQKHYKTFDISRWRQIFIEWLGLWGWRIVTVHAQALDTVSFQLGERWQALLQKFESLDRVQPKIGRRRAIELVSKLSKEELFLPKASDSPIVVSGVFEALNAYCDKCYITGMTEAYPAPANLEPFVANALRESTSYPSANPVSHLEQAKSVMESLLSSAFSYQVSYHKQDPDIEGVQLQASSLFRGCNFSQKSTLMKKPAELGLDQFKDQYGNKVEDVSSLRGGTAIFTDQSACPFKAFAKHRLQCASEREVEFGLDPLDRGNIVHALLENCWAALKTHDALLEYSQKGLLATFIESIVDKTLTENHASMGGAKSRLAMIERPRLISLLDQWLKLELKRPGGFAVEKVEQQGSHTVGGLPFTFKIDRIERTEDQRLLLMDYKTGMVNRKDLVGERLRQPQLPLYLDAIKAQSADPIAGVAFAQVRQNEHAFSELSEIGYFDRSERYAQRYQEQWQTESASWPQKLEQLAEEFLSGLATVDPIDQNECTYCDLHSFCRVKLGENSSGDSSE